MRKLMTIFALFTLVWALVMHWPQWNVTPPIHVSIAELAQNSASYLDQRIRVQGRVLGCFKALGFTAYLLDDGHGERIDVAGFATAPEPGDVITVTGKFRLIKLSDALQAPVLFVN